MKKIFSLLSTAFLSVLLFSCSTDDNYDDLSNLVGGFTMVNAYESDAAVLYVADGRPVQNPYYPLFYQSVGYVNLWQGIRNIDVLGSISNKRLTSNIQKIESQKFYTSFIGGSSKKVIHFITEDQIKKINPLNGTKQSGVRFFNLSSDDVTATVEFDDKILVKEFEARVQDDEKTAIKTQEFSTVESKTYMISIKDKEGKVLVTRDKVIFNPSQYYSIILIGSKDNKEKPYYIGIINQAVK
ncbi:hypothetical protein LNQ81_11260 [Myroides sp. M-43]|uniref:hypothetical protein n=1 Tax=Myroides oncorhynchi TaxID=2893756 RepID=UPI001E63BB12|nr:hypothetical protein [Myroides oncorhynchi]MCC9043248.1 hypothetical protein [Myroides oncorhynchi]